MVERELFPKSQMGMVQTAIGGFLYSNRPEYLIVNRFHVPF